MSLSFRGPLTVVYCSSCGLPPEYCEFGPTWEKCKILLEKENPDILAAALAHMKIAPPPATPATSSNTNGEEESKEMDETKKKKKKSSDDDDEEEEDDDSEDDDADDEPVGGGGDDDEFLAAAAPVKSAKKPSSGPGIYLSMANRSKRKFITTVAGFESFGITLKDVAKQMAKKFACAASVVKSKDGNEIAIQGDLIQDLPHWIIEEFPQIDKKLIWTVDKAGKKVKAF